MIIALTQHPVSALLRAPYPDYLFHPDNPKREASCVPASNPRNKGQTT